MSKRGDPRGVGLRRRWQRPAPLSVLAAMLLALALLLLFGAMPMLAPLGAPVRQALAAGEHAAEAPNDTPTATETPTATPTDTPTTAPQATLDVDSPAPATGPVGAHVRLHGTHWGAFTVTIGAVASGGSCSDLSSWTNLVAATPIGSTHSFEQTFIWPVALNNLAGAYAICARDSAGHTASTQYTVLSSAPPNISLSQGSVQVGSSVSISGNNFFTGSAIIIALQAGTGSGAQTRQVGSAQAANDGTFTFTYTPNPQDIGTLTIIAETPVQSPYPPTLFASASLNVLATPSPTATVALSPTATVSAPISVPGLPRTTGNSPSGLVVGLIAAMALVLAIIIGVVAFLLLRGKNDGQPPEGGMWPNPGDRSPYGASGTYRTPASPGQGAQPPRLGGVARWGNDVGDPVDSLDGPGPDWHGKTMTGTRPRIPTVNPQGGDPGGAPTYRMPTAPADPYQQSRPGGASGYGPSRMPPNMPHGAPGDPPDPWARGNEPPWHDSQENGQPPYGQPNGGPDDPFDPPDSGGWTPGGGGW